MLYLKILFYLLVRVTLYSRLFFFLTRTLPWTVLHFWMISNGMFSSVAYKHYSKIVLVLLRCGQRDG